MPRNPIEGTYGTPKTAQEYREASKAGFWRHNPELEELARLEKSHPDLAATLGAQAPLRLGLYLDAKQSAANYGVDTTTEGAA